MESSIEAKVTTEFVGFAAYQLPFPQKHGPGFHLRGDVIVRN